MMPKGRPSTGIYHYKMFAATLRFDRAATGMSSRLRDGDDDNADDDRVAATPY